MGVVGSRQRLGAGQPRGPAAQGNQLEMQMPSGQAQGSMWYQALQGILRCENCQLSGRILTGMENGGGGDEGGEGVAQGKHHLDSRRHLVPDPVESKGKTEGK